MPTPSAPKRTPLDHVIDGVRDRLAQLRGDDSFRAWQEKLRRKTGYSPKSHNTIRRQESGDTEISFRYLAAVAMMTGCDLRWLMWDQGEPNLQTERLPPEQARELTETVEQMFNSKPPARQGRRRAGVKDGG